MRKPDNYLLIYLRQHSRAQQAIERDRLKREKKPKPHKAIYTGEKRAHVVEQTKYMLKSGRCSLFEHEGSCINGIRSSLCLKGHGWTAADNEARAIVQEALNLLDAKRPTWFEGQAYITTSPDYCSWCHGEIEETDKYPGRRFCSSICAKSAIEHRDRERGVGVDAVMATAYKLIWLERSPYRPCRGCGTMFQHYRAEAIYCSSECASRDRRTIEERPCLWCEEVFRPDNDKEQCCSLSCARHLDVQRYRDQAPERECACCKAIFRPAISGAIYCSKICRSRMVNRAYRERKGPAKGFQILCQWCEHEFTAKTPWAKYCCDHHKMLGRARAKREERMQPEVIYLTAEVFDGWFKRAA